MNSIFHLVFSIIVFTRFEKSLEQPRSFDLNEYPTMPPTPSVTDDNSLQQPEPSNSNEVSQKKENSSNLNEIDFKNLFKAHYAIEIITSQKEYKNKEFKNDNFKNKRWPELRPGITKFNTELWGTFCMYLLKQSRNLLNQNIYCEPGACKTSNAGYKIMYLYGEKTNIIEEIETLQCFCYKLPFQNKQPQYPIFVTKFSNSEYFVAEVYRGKKVLNLVSFVQNVPASLVETLRDADTYYDEFRKTYHL